MAILRFTCPAVWSAEQTVMDSATPTRNWTTILLEPKIRLTRCPTESHESMVIGTLILKEAEK